VADELVVGTVVAAEQQPGARAPALLLTLDLGTYGREEAVISGFEPEGLVGSQLLCRRRDDAVTVVSAHSHGKGDVVLRPDDEVEPGTLVG
jgi:hypothetical protein